MLFRSDRKSTRLNSSHTIISYAVFCLKKKSGSEEHTSELQSHDNIVWRLLLEKKRKRNSGEEGVAWSGGGLGRGGRHGAWVSACCAGSRSVIFYYLLFSFLFFYFFFFNNTAPPEISSFSQTGALPI